MAEAVATLGATSLQNGATGTGGHTVAKAVFTALFAIVWLKGAFHARLLTSKEIGTSQARGKIWPRATQKGGFLSISLPVENLLLSLSPQKFWE